MKDELRKLILANNMTIVMATVAQLVREEADELRTMENATDDATADKMDEVFSHLLKAVELYSDL